ncbi:DNA-directed RNA polymerase III subunit RPC8-like [Gigantopelta aegis]|uniref:DNA-directed RNA polymerase III subunit RPC8-like n=1 Tax=Gigantopelta aegis TaxID=1735272 RepID=UPI001B88CF45|nr:DNA-directed RNA polymerase III subunit RPC8-like [Gigantopelta aegis]XP_041364732.1 DNA-directed RNA polymerase III subunit RPC8-like [Gigantopelta aegis]
MFVLSEMKDTVRIPPWLFKLDTKDAIIETLNKKLANKVMYNVGLCIALWDIEKFEDSYIFPGDGASHTIVHFRYVVFRPFIDEILIGKIKGSSKEGVMVSIGFFDDILIPADSMQHPSKFDEQEQLWFWEYQLEDGNKHTLFMDIGEQIRFRIVDEMFTDTTPCGPDGGMPETPEIAVLDPESRKSPFSLTGSVSEPGLGLLSWWNT